MPAYPRAKIQAVAYHLPEGILDNEELALLFPEWPAQRIEDKLGIRCRRIAAPDECASDLAVSAAIRLFEDTSVKASQIDYLIFCTQSPDYLLPTSACLIQDRLGIPRNSGAVDFNQGCSGYVYGLGLAKGLIETHQAGTVLLLTGETYSKFLAPADKTTRTLFGDAGSATLITREENEKELIGPFLYGTDGSGAGHLILKAGGGRHHSSPSLNDASLCMNGGEIFAFTLKEVSKSIDLLLQKTRLGIPDIDLFIFHQANQYMLEQLRLKCKIPREKFYIWLAEVGNTVSNSIPIAIKEAQASGALRPGMRVMLVGFGVGLSWGGCLVQF